MWNEDAPCLLAAFLSAENQIREKKKKAHLQRKTSMQTHTWKEDNTWVHIFLPGFL